MKDHPKPKVKFCWHCGRKLQGRHHVIMFIDNELRTMHESCGKKHSVPNETPKHTVLPKGLVEEMWLSGERTINDLRSKKPHKPT